ncbi:zinc ribbon domain-containing protein [Ktedonobacter sp. SOSP1-85]|uniref:zinc ribbon domain-containing protein n=1 Tax=Ktedonobacter sp. SOSP1-85 TaxID=2778367 RepID=UPI0019158038|nr:zinc ribbon domain-containing protein [Ktedonobacter sp. SOSP1-85]
MRCPYCGEPNNNASASFCIRCGRDLKTGAQVRPRQRSFQPPQGAPAPHNMSQPQPGSGPYYAPSSYQVPGGAVNPMPANIPGQRQPGTPTQSGRATRPKASSGQVARREELNLLTPIMAPVQGPQAPESFPPRTFAQLIALEREALDYKVLSDDQGYGRKKIIKIEFARSVPWLQVATLLNALSKYRSTSSDTIIIQGSYPQSSNLYDFSNGQLQYDHNVRLGSQMVDRYLIDSGTGLESDGVRIVFTERGK